MQFFLDTLKYQIFRYIYLLIYIICRFYVIWVVSRNKIIEVSLIWVVILNSDEYCIFECLLFSKDLIYCERLKWIKSIQL